ncbi:hypothetical protein D8Y22_14525 [Salinadaptatus halalkaliphilus]|uniref:Uncharacterized protein n=1 Tax=Salinadaptatus halalkaliphilus TaxID=2419781 RepID=A0A4S3TJ52_9EURY|nr:hypothetical protein [Salinadaptatus halalkaliphilus]THE64124.1 hypothetical protein D8Y22_14525 [Salinadaptatus halalkaliphilus]
MSSENAPDRSVGDRVAGYLSQVHDTYDRVENRVRHYTPSVVRVIEVVLALALLAVLSHWVYWVYVTGA